MCSMIGMTMTTPMQCMRGSNDDNEYNECKDDDDNDEEGDVI